jgi:hypothetical protein
MYLIDYKDNSFNIDIKLEENEDKSNFQDHVNYLKYHFLYFSSNTKKWNLPINRVDEILSWFERHYKNYKVTDEALDQLEKILNKKEEVKFFNNKKFDISILKENKRKDLKQFQKEEILWRLQRNRYLDALDVGLGKTLINACVFSQLYKENKVDGIIILCPLGLEYQWKYEILNWIDLFKKEDFLIVNNENKEQPFSCNKNKKIIIIQNHIFKDVILSYKKGYNFGKSAKKIKWKEYVNVPKEWGKKNIFILIDESSDFRHTKSIKTKALNSIKHRFKYRAEISATPFINRIEDAYFQINFLDESIINISENAFILYLADELWDSKYGRFNIRRYNNINVDKFYKNISPVFRRKLQSDIPEMKTKKIIKPIPIEMNEIQRKIYQAVVEEEIYKLEEDYDKVSWGLVLNKFHIISQAIDNPMLFKDRIISNNLSGLLDKWELSKDYKFNLLKSLIHRYIDDYKEKLIVYAIHPKTLDMLNNQFEKYNPLLIHGELNVKDKNLDREEKKRLFNEDDKYKIFFISALASARGINLQKKCRRIFVYEIPNDAERFEQLSGRTARIDSVNDSIIEIPVTQDTINVVQYNRTVNRVNLNNLMSKEISKGELRNLLQGII